MPIDSPSSSLIQRFVYISRLSPDTPPEAVSQILRQSRERNRFDDISGALIFDGERFCQLIEGTPEAVGRLAQCITSDPRHCNVQVLFNEASPTPRLLSHWQTGYCEHEVLDALDGTVPAGPERLLTAFMHLLTVCDLSR